MLMEGSSLWKSVIDLESDFDAGEFSSESE
jgi:hypothetical protein